MSRFDQPCIIISSPRSGSKLLRELIMQSGEFCCYPYDINYIWMKGHLGKNDDELTEKDFSQRNAAYIREYLSRLLADKPNARVLEKTVSNALRLKYVLKVLPEAKVIHLIRDGREATASIKSCWLDSAFSERNQDRSLQIQKLKNFPIASAGPYLVKYVKNNIPRLFGVRSVKSWGPRFRGMDDMLRKSTLAEVCANQWARSVKEASAVLNNRANDGTYIEIRYEDLTQDSKKVIAEISAFLNLGADSLIQMEHWASRKFRKSTYTWESRLDSHEQSLVMPILEKELVRLEYV